MKTLKKALTGLLTIFILFTLAACNDNTVKNTPPQNENNIQQETSSNNKNTTALPDNNNSISETTTEIPLNEPATSEEITELFWNELGGYWALIDDETGEITTPFFIAFTYFADGEPIYSRMKQDGSAWSLIDLMQLNENEYQLDFKMHPTGGEDSYVEPKSEFYITCIYDITDKDNGIITETTTYGFPDEIFICKFKFLAKTQEEASVLMQEIWDSFLPPPPLEQ